MKKITYKEMFELINKVEAFNKPITMCLTQDTFDLYDWEGFIGHNIEYRIIPNEFNCDDNMVYIIPNKSIKVQTKYDIVEIKDDEM